MDLPHTWVSENLSNKIDSVAFKTKESKLELIKKYNPFLDLEGFLTDVNEPTITEYLSFIVARKMNRTDLEELSPMLQAFITYRISVYDYLEDEHLYKCGKETVLKTKGKGYLLKMMEAYAEISHNLSRKLPTLRIDDAVRIADMQYEEIIQADKKRNSGIHSLDKTMKIQESLAGESARKLAYLSGGDKLEQECLFYLVNSICTLEDLMHLLIKEDLEQPKSTIPLAFINELEPINIAKDKPSYKILLDDSIRFTLGYISEQMGRLNELIKKSNFGELNDFTESIDTFIKKHILPKT